MTHFEIAMYAGGAVVFLGLSAGLALLVGKVIHRADRRELALCLPSPVWSDVDPGEEPGPRTEFGRVYAIACLRAADGDPELAYRIYGLFLKQEPRGDTWPEFWAAVQQDARFALFQLESTGG